MRSKQNVAYLQLFFVEGLTVLGSVEESDHFDDVDDDYDDADDDDDEDDNVDDDDHDGR